MALIELELHYLHADYSRLIRQAVLYITFAVRVTGKNFTDVM